MGVAIAWPLFPAESREAFRTTLSLDDGIWARGRGRARRKGLIALAEHIDTDGARSEEARRVIEEVLADVPGGGRARSASAPLAP